MLSTDEPSPPGSTRALNSRPHEKLVASDDHWIRCSLSQNDAWWVTLGSVVRKARHSASTPTGKGCVSRGATAPDPTAGLPPDPTESVPMVPPSRPTSKRRRRAPSLVVALVL